MSIEDDNSDIGKSKDKSKSSSSDPNSDENKKKKSSVAAPSSTLNGLDSLGAQYRMYQQPPSYTYNPQTGGSYTVGNRFDPNKIGNPNDFRNQLSPGGQTLFEAQRRAALDSGTQVRAFSGRAGRITNTPNHPAGNAIDVSLASPGASVYAPSYQNPASFRQYEKFAQDTKRELDNQGYKGPVRWGGYFSGGPNPGDLMHMDVTPGGATAGGSWAGGATRQQLASLPGATSQGMGPARIAAVRSSDVKAPNVTYKQVDHDPFAANPPVNRPVPVNPNALVQRDAVVGGLPGEKPAAPAAPPRRTAQGDTGASPYAPPVRTAQRDQGASPASPPRRTPQGTTGAAQGEPRVTVADVPQVPSLARFGARPPQANDTERPAVRTAQGDTGISPAGPPRRTAQIDQGASPAGPPRRTAQMDQGASPAGPPRQVVQGDTGTSPSAPQQVAAAEPKPLIPKDGILGVRGAIRRAEDSIPKDGILGVRGAIKKAEGKIIPKDGILGLRGMRARGEDRLPGENDLGRAMEHVPVVGAFLKGVGALDHMARTANAGKGIVADGTAQEDTRTAYLGNDPTDDVGRGHDTGGRSYAVPQSVLMALLSQARQAPDGNWYVTSQDTPGQYYMVNADG